MYVVLCFVVEKATNLVLCMLCWQQGRLDSAQLKGANDYFAQKQFLSEYPDNDHTHYYSLRSNALTLRSIPIRL